MFPRKRLFFLLGLAFLMLPAGQLAAPRPLMARCIAPQCPLFSHWSCSIAGDGGGCVCDCPAPGADPTDLSSCGPCY